MNIKTILASSEFWMGLLGLIGSALAYAGVVPQEQWNTLVVPIAVYVLGRVTSKVVKAVPSNGGSNA